MVIALLLALGLASASLSVSSGEAGGLPTSKLVVQAMHTTWPDGSPVESGGTNYPTDIYVVDASGKHVRNLTHDAPTNYLIDPLPAGRRILYESVPNDRMRAGPSGIFSINADGSGRQQLASGKDELAPKLSPDGRRISFTRGRWLYDVRSDGTHAIALAQTSFGSYRSEDARYYVSWSPDGKRIAFVRGFAKQGAPVEQLIARSAIYVINADGTGLRRMTKLRGKVQALDPAWSPDGRRIAFDEGSDAAIASGGGHAYVMRADGTDVKRLKQPGTNWFWLSNDRLAYDAYGYGRSESVDANGKGKPRPVPDRVRVGGDLWITSGRSAGFWPVSPDGNRIAYIGGRDRWNGDRIWIAHLDGTHRRLVTRKICCFLDPGLRDPFFNSAIEWAGN